MFPGPSAKSGRTRPFSPGSGVLTARHRDVVPGVEEFGEVVAQGAHGLGAVTARVVGEDDDAGRGSSSTREMMVAVPGVVQSRLSTVQASGSMPRSAPIWKVARFQAP